MHCEDHNYVFDGVEMFDDHVCVYEYCDGYVDGEPCDASQSTYYYVQPAVSVYVNTDLQAEFILDEEIVMDLIADDYLVDNARLAAMDDKDGFECYKVVDKGEHCIELGTTFRDDSVSEQKVLIPRE